MMSTRIHVDFAQSFEAHEDSLVESGQALSESVIWRWQHEGFEQAGLEIWSDDVVPHHVNTNPFRLHRDRGGRQC